MSGSPQLYVPPHSSASLILDNSAFTVSSITETGSKSITGDLTVGGTTEAKRFKVTVSDITIAGTYTVTATDNQVIRAVSTPSNSTVKLPDATTISPGFSVDILNRNTSTSVLSITNNSSTVLRTVAINSGTRIILVSSSTVAGVWRVDVDRTLQEISVGPTDADFTSIKSAVDSITDNSASKPYLISIKPGVYTEAAIVLKPYVYLDGSGSLITTITASSPTQKVITGADNSQVSHVLITGATGSGGTGVYHEGSGTLLPFIVDDCILGDCETLAQAHGASLPTILLVSDCKAGGIYNSTTCFKCTNAGTTFTQLAIQNVSVQDVVSPIPDSLVQCTGPGTQIVLSNVTVRLASATGNAVRISNGAEARLFSCTFRGFTRGILVESTGSAPLLKAVGVNIESCTKDLVVEHSGTTGFFNGVLDASKTFIHDSSSFHIFEKNLNIVEVAKRGGDYTSLNTALSNINPTISIGTTATFTTITSSTSSFNITLNGKEVQATGVPSGTTATYVSETTMTLSAAATATGTVSAKFIRATSTSPFGVFIGPGTYTETPISLDSYITISGANNTISTLTPSTSSSTFITAQNKTGITISNIYIKGIGATDTSSIGILCDSTTSLGLKSLILSDFETVIKNIATITGKPAEINADDILINGNFKRGIHMNGTAATSLSDVELNMHSSEIFGGSLTEYCMKFEGPNCKNNDIFSVHLDGAEPVTGTGIIVNDGVEITATNMIIEDFTTAIDVQSIGAAPTIQLVISTIDNCTNHLVISHAGTTGSVFGTFSRTATTINSSSTVSVSFSDPVSQGFVSVGSLYLGLTTDALAESTHLIQNTPTMGLINGGALTAGAGTTVNVSAGFGYVMSGTFPSHVLKKIEWSATSLLLPVSTASYIYFDSSSTLTSSTAFPSITGVVYLGRVRTTSSTFEFFDLTAIDAHHNPNKVRNMIRNTFAVLYSSGSITTANSSRQLTITSGKYYYGEREFNPSGQSSPATFSTYYHSSGAFTMTTGVTAVPYTQYDNGTNLVAFTPGFYTNHTLYIVGEGTNEKYFLVYGQAEYATEALAEAAAIPSPPSYFTEGVIRIAKILVWDGFPTYTKIFDTRPFISTTASTLTSTADHGSLSGLLDDDHTQYLLIAGTRAMTGDLNMGSQSITSVNLVDGVDVSAHASRHLPLGADALTTVAPLANLTASTSNATGTANSLARSDHSHALTTGAPSTQIPDQANATGSSASLARADHIHAIATAAPAANLTATTTNATGTATSFSRSDHSHALTTGAPSTQTPDQANATGSSASLARADHIHNIPSATPVTISSSNSQGTAASFALSDHVHQGTRSLKANAGGTQRFGDIIFLAGTAITLTDSPAGTFTIDVVTSALDHGSLSGLLDDDHTQYVLVTGTRAMTGALTINPTTNQILLGGVVTGRTLTINAVEPATSSRVITIPDPGAAANFIISETAQTLNGAKTFSSPIIINPTTNQLVLGVTNTTTISATAPAASRTYTIPDVLGAADFILSAGTQTIGGSKTFSSPIIINPTTNQLVLGVTNTTTISATAPAASRTYTMPDVLANADFILSAGTQTIGGSKTFSSSLTINPTTNQLVLGVTNTTTISATAPAASRTYTIPDVLGAADFVMTAGTQTIGGSKTLSSALTINPTTNQLVLGVTNTTTISATAPAASRTYTMPDVLANADFILSAGTQTIGGSKTFSSSLTINPTTNQLVLGVTNTTTISATAPAASRTYTIPDVLGAADFVMTAGTQTIGGSKTLSSALTITPTTNQLVLGVTNTTTISAPAPASSITLTLPNTADTLVGRATTDTLTNKTITSSTNTVDANALKTTGASVNVSSSAAPVQGNVLMATAATTSVWKTHYTAYTLSSLQLTATSTTLTTTSFFPWLNSRYSGIYASGALVFEAVIVDRNLNVQLRDTTNSVNLIASTTVSASGHTSIAITTMPTANARVELQISKASGGGTSPTIFGVSLEFAG